ncbi:MAG: Wzz/FepE/Etk N-terminal domain-containing protein [Sphingomonadaceae bacterium]|nr:Wzz/FepE/Etk N-terminal domain-containing protein [Sphingomonadaceae bacterium]
MRNRSALDGIDIAGLALKVWRHKWLGMAIVLASLLIGISYLKSASYEYTAELVVTPADQDAPKASGSLSSLGSLVGINIGGQQGSAFAMYTEAVKSHAVAERLSRDPRIMRTIFAGSWDDATSRWVERPSSTRPLVVAIKNLIGIPNKPWQPPNSQDLHQYLSTAMQVSEDTKKGIVRLTYRHVDPAFARYLLTEANQDADDFLRRKSLNRAVTYIRYLERRLQQVQVAEYRQSLSETLGAYEKTTMMASSDASFAVEPFGDVWVSPYPTSPNPKAVLALSVVAGILIWLFLVLVVMPIAAMLRTRSEAAPDES